MRNSKQFSLQLMYFVVHVQIEKGLTRVKVLLPRRNSSLQPSAQASSRRFSSLAFPPVLFLYLIVPSQPALRGPRETLPILPSFFVCVNGLSVGIAMREMSICFHELTPSNGCGLWIGIGIEV